jgi:low temperature requirement protein LtrA
VISIAELVHTLEDYRTPADVLGTAGLFVAVWWAWVGYPTVKYYPGYGRTHLRPAERRPRAGHRSRW